MQGPPATLTWNDSGRFEDRWVQLGVDGTTSVFLNGIESMYLPIAHAEGKFVPCCDKVRDRLAAAGHLALRYRPLNNGTDATLDAPVPFPDNPNGSVLNVAGVLRFYRSRSRSHAAPRTPHPSHPAPPLDPRRRQRKRRRVEDVPKCCRAFCVTWRCFPRPASRVVPSSSSGCWGPQYPRGE